MIMLIVAACAWILWRARTQRRYLTLLPPLIFGVAFAAVFYAPSFLHGEFSRRTSPSSARAICSCCCASG